MSTKRPAFTSRLVAALSAADGVGSPPGWLWMAMAEVAPAARASLKNDRGPASVPSTSPRLTTRGSPMSLDFGSSGKHQSSSCGFPMKLAPIAATTASGVFRLGRVRRRACDTRRASSKAAATRDADPGVMPDRTKSGASRPASPTKPSATASRRPALSWPFRPWLMINASRSWSLNAALPVWSMASRTHDGCLFSAVTRPLRWTVPRSAPPAVPPSARHRPAPRSAGHRPAPR